MLRVVLKLALAAAAVWVVWSYVPVHGRSLADRWRSAGNVSAFVERGWAELQGKPARAPARSQARSPSRERPAEGHTEADRRAVDRILSERLDERR